MTRDRNVFEQAGFDVVEYVKLRMDDFKLGLIDHLSALSSTIFGIILCAMLAGMALLFLAAAAVWGLTELMGSFVWASLLVAFVLLAAAAVVFALRDKLIVNPMVRLFCKMFFDKRHKYGDYE